VTSSNVIHDFPANLIDSTGMLTSPTDKRDNTDYHGMKKSA
jgi:hypothetical protein